MQTVNKSIYPHVAALAPVALVLGAMALSLLSLIRLEEKNRAGVEVLIPAYCPASSE